ncbi:hypothetical protein BGX29_000121 [Mortierella sp. GBA35]|nr:hypothetical protein BGX29_000121 [Mortierella sp. GBA35]
MQGLDRTLRQNGSSPRRLIQALWDAQNTGGTTPLSRQTYETIGSILRSCIAENNLHRFYPAGSARLDQIIRRIARTNFQKIALNWNGVSLQLAQVLCKLALYDIILLVDDSSSIRTANPVDGRMAELMFVSSVIADVAALFDDDGIDIEFLNCEGSYKEIRGGRVAGQILNRCGFSGNTRLGYALHRKIHSRFFNRAPQPSPLRMHKPVLVYIITDGEPCGEPREALERQIRRGSDYLRSQGYPADLFRYQIAQVGNDLRSTAYLNELDQRPGLGELIDVTSRYGIEVRQIPRLTPELYLVKLLLGAIDRRFDAMDETRQRLAPGRYY